MKFAESIGRVSYKRLGADPIQLQNTTVERRVKKGDKWEKEQAPRVKREFGVPENHDEFLVAIGGEQNLERAYTRIFEDASLAVARAKLLAAQGKNEPVETALQIYLDSSKSFSMADWLIEETKDERATKAITQNDQISALSVRMSAGEISPAEFAQKVQEILGVARQGA